MKMRLWPSIGTAAALLCTALGAQSAQDGQPHPHQTMSHRADSAFVLAASAAGLGEVAAGNMAASQGQSAAVTSFGQVMVTDHTAANLALKQIADAKGMTLATAPSADQQVAIDTLKALRGSSFDKSYAPMALKDHTAAVALFEHEASSGKDADVRAFARKTLPTLKQHLDMATHLSGT